MRNACRPYRKLISLEMDGELDDVRGAELARHLASCSDCRSEQGLWRRIRALLPVEGETAAGGIAARVVDGLRRRRLDEERALPLIRRTAAAAALVIAAAVTALLFLPDRPGHETIVPEASRDLGRALILGHGPVRALTSAPEGETR